MDMSAHALFFRDPDGNPLELICTGVYAWGKPPTTEADGPMADGRDGQLRGLSQVRRGSSATPQRGSLGRVT